jgi:hypothetical protein
MMRSNFRVVACSLLLLSLVHLHPREKERSVINEAVHRPEPGGTRSRNRKHRALIGGVRPRPVVLIGTALSCAGGDRDGVVDEAVRLHATGEVAAPTNVSAKIRTLVPFPGGTECAPSAPSQPCWQGKNAADVHSAGGGGGTEVVCETPQESKMPDRRKWVRTTTICPVFIVIPLGHFPSAPVRSGQSQITLASWKTSPRRQRLKPTAAGGYPGKIRIRSSARTAPVARCPYQPDLSWRWRSSGRPFQSCD